MKENEQPIDRTHPYAERPTPRQLEVLQLFANGVTSRTKVGEQLGVTEQTVNTHLRRAYLNLNANNRMHAVAIAMRKGWIE
jgi:DNA-binding NarL/FixJ family response regulator